MTISPGCLVVAVIVGACVWGAVDSGNDDAAVPSDDVTGDGVEGYLECDVTIYPRDGYHWVLQPDGGVRAAKD